MWLRIHRLSTFSARSVSALPEKIPSGSSALPEEVPSGSSTLPEEVPSLSFRNLSTRSKIVTLFSGSGCALSVSSMIGFQSDLFQGIVSTASVFETGFIGLAFLSGCWLWKFVTPESRIQDVLLELRQIQTDPKVDFLLDSTCSIPDPNQIERRFYQHQLPIATAFEYWSQRDQQLVQMANELRSIDLIQESSSPFHQMLINESLPSEIERTHSRLQDAMVEIKKLPGWSPTPPSTEFSFGLFKRS